MYLYYQPFVSISWHDDDNCMKITFAVFETFAETATFQKFTKLNRIATGIHFHYFIIKFNLFVRFWSILKLGTYRGSAATRQTPAERMEREQVLRSVEILTQCYRRTDKCTTDWAKGKE